MLHLGGPNAIYEMEEEDQVAAIGLIMAKRSGKWSWGSHAPLSLRDAATLNNHTARQGKTPGRGTGVSELDEFNAQFGERE